jgi:hypothetical protein
LYLLKLLAIPAVLVITFLFFKLTTKYWNGSDKVSYVYREESGNVVVTVLDPKLSEATSLIIPGDTQVNVAGNYGTLRIKNVWQLGINEKKEHLLASTLTKSFYFPVFLWTGSDAENLRNSNLPGIIKFVFAPQKTNIPLGDRALIGIFSLQVSAIDRTEIDLGESKFLRKMQLNDGESGYVMAGPISERLSVYFSDNDFADENLKAGIIDATGDPKVAGDVGQIIQVLGGKIISVEKKTTPSESDCFVLGNNAKVVEKLSNLFDCKKLNEDTTLDLEIRLGKEFAKRF